jgi:hypothetical protein
MSNQFPVEPKVFFSKDKLSEIHLFSSRQTTIIHWANKHFISARNSYFIYILTLNSRDKAGIKRNASSNKHKTKKKEEMIFSPLHIIFDKKYKSFVYWRWKIRWGWKIKYKLFANKYTKSIIFFCCVKNLILRHI